MSSIRKTHRRRSSVKNLPIGAAEVAEAAEHEAAPEAVPEPAALAEAAPEDAAWAAAAAGAAAAAAVAAWRGLCPAFRL